MPSSFVDALSFQAAGGGTGAFVVSSARDGSYRTIAQAIASGNLVDGATVSYTAVDSVASPHQREWGDGTVDAANNRILRTTVLGSMNSGTPGAAGVALSFTIPPVVLLTVLAEDLSSLAASSSDVISVTDTRFAGGAKGDDTTDDLPAFNAALAYLKARGGGSLYVPPPPGGAYYLSGPLNVHFPVRIFGDPGGETINLPILRFAANQWGIVLHEYRTLDNGGGNASTPSGLGDANGSVIENIVVWGGGAQHVTGPYTNPSATNRGAHGIWIRTTFCIIRGCGVAFCSGNGFNINATSGSSGANAGQANLNYFEYCNAQYNSCDGFSISGSDSNACIILGCSSISNGRAGFREYSFLGNTYIQCHTRDNSGGDPNHAGNLGGTCTYLGHQYYIAGALNGGTQQTLASTTVPGTNSAVWANDDNIISGVGLPTWTTGKSWTISAPYLTLPGNVNARNVFLGCYTELAQPPIQSTTPTIFVGGALDVGFDLSGTPGAIAAGSANQGLTVQSNFIGFWPNGSTNLQVNFGTGGDVAAPGRTLISAQDNATGANWAWTYDGTSRLVLQHNHVTTTELWGLANDARPYSHSLNYLIIAQPTNVVNGIRLSSINQISDLNGLTVALGDVFLYSANTRPAGMGAVCTTAGTVGSGAVLMEFGQPVLTGGFANLPSSPRLGQIAQLNNCSTNVWGAVADGAGALTVLVWWNGSNWTVIGK